MRRMSQAQADSVSAAGGMLRQTLLFAFTRFTDGIDAFFGHAGDTRAREVDLAAGFRETEDRHLLINPVRDLSEAEERALFEQAMALGNF